MSDSTELELKAPLSGIVIPLDDVPDAVFAQRMVGDGVSIEPVTSSLTAPCDGRIVQLHTAGHAVTLATPHGIEVLMHIGLDTVQLKGRGFTARVKAGDVVQTGDVLIDFDADCVATHARSLMTEIVITTTDRVAAIRTASGVVTAGRDTLMRVTLTNGGQTDAAAGAGAVHSPPLAVSNPSGIHARPAAVLANRAKQFAADIRVRRGSDEASARSVVGIMGLEIACGDSIELVATGSDADEAVRVLSQLVREGLGESAAAPHTAAAPVTERAPARSNDPNLLTGIGASPGIAVGRVVQLRRGAVRIVEAADDARHERQALDAAIEHAKAELDALCDRLQQEGAGDKAGIFAAHRELLDDPDLLDTASDVVAQGKSAAFAWQLAVTRHAGRLASLKNELIAARANDVRDVGRRVLARLADLPEEPADYPPESILVAEELTPSDMAALDRNRVVGLCTTTGGASSHVAILARSFELPLVAGVDPLALDVPDGTPAILDAMRGTLRANPDAVDTERVLRLRDDLARERRVQHSQAHEPATTTDGRRVDVDANIGAHADVEPAVGLGADGVGLFRTEFLFLHRATPPSDDEQLAAYRDVVRALGPNRRAVFRTLDVGGDKPLPYLPLPREDNPFLGERGIRVMLNRPDMLRAQLRAILLAARDGRVAVMFPMIATIEEWRAAREVLDDERRRLNAPPVETGIMIEVPSAALMADQFAAEVDFFSIGTNDLTQYTLAMDRGHPRLAPQVDALSPAVLRLIDRTARAARDRGRHVAVCGGIAADPLAIPLLLGMGIDELSVTVPAIPAVKAQVRGLRLAECRALAEAALACTTAAQVRALVPQGVRS